MAGTMASVGESTQSTAETKVSKEKILGSILRLSEWLQRNNYQGYDAFDGLNAKIRPLTFNNPLLLTILQQGVRRFPINTRPLLGIGKEYSSKAMGFLARGFMRMQEATGDAAWNKKAESALDWLAQHQCTGYTGACWGNHFDYQSRSFFLPKGVPTVVWTALIGHAFLDAYQHFGDSVFLKIADSACKHILNDLDTFKDGAGICISYIPIQNKQVHNANTLGASLLARTFSFTGDTAYRDLAQKSMQYTAQYQRPDASWFYGENGNLHWVDNFHTAYVLDCFKHYQASTGNRQFENNMMRGYEYWKKIFFLPDGTPRYYDHKTLPLDIQCSSQAIDTLVFFADIDPQSVELATKVADWTITNMQDSSGYFYYRRYSKWLVNKTATLHWGQATMLCALAGLYRIL
jgi:polysaccharide biosynthesis protein VpsJ